MRLPFTTTARRLRRDQTDAERLLWYRLRARQLGAKFRRQQPLGRFIVDFYCDSARLAVELDGAQHGDPAAQAQDAARDAWLERVRIRVLRFQNRDVLTQIDAVLERIVEALGG